MTNILIADDHYIVRRGLRALLKNALSTCMISEAEDTDQIFAHLKNNTPDLLILDVKLQDSKPFSFFELLRLRFPKLDVLVFSMFPEDIFAKRYLALGAKGYLSKSLDDGPILQAVQKVLNKQIYMSDNMTRLFAQSHISGSPVNIFDRLSNREMEVFLLLVEGQSQKNIAKILNIHSSTIATYKSRICEKLEADTLIDLQKLANTYDVV